MPSRCLAALFAAVVFTTVIIVATPRLRSAPCEELRGEASNSVDPVRLASAADAAGGTRGSGAINYYLDPARFTNAVMACVRDATCRILYHHVGKTGGTSIESRMFRMFPPRMKIPTCCGSDLMKRFRERKKAYCGAKFSSYQLVGKNFIDVVADCMDLINDYYATKKEKRRPRAIVITSFREPIQRCLSSIHQTCNKRLHKRSNRTIRACEACSYDVEPDVWDSHVRQTNVHFEGIVRVARHLPEHVDAVRVLSIEMRDIDAFFDSLREPLGPLGVQVPPSETRNAQKDQHCSFSMSSAMMKALAPSEDIYRNLTLGY